MLFDSFADDLAYPAARMPRSAVGDCAAAPTLIVARHAASRCKPKIMNTISITPVPQTPFKRNPNSKSCLRTFVRPAPTHGSESYACATGLVASARSMNQRNRSAKNLGIVGGPYKIYHVCKPYLPRDRDVDRQRLVKRIDGEQPQRHDRHHAITRVIDGRDGKRGVRCAWVLCGGVGPTLKFQPRFF
jgi:hypothetical protein